MSEKKNIISSSPKSANMTLTNEYLILNGGHYEITNGYTKYVRQAKTIVLKDILSIEYVTMRSKTLLKMFIMLCSALFAGDLVIRTISSVMNWTDKKWNMLGTIYQVLIENEQGMNLLSIILLFYLLLVIIAGVLVIMYIFFPHRFLLISALGQTVAIEYRYYEKCELEKIKIKEII